MTRCLVLIRHAESDKRADSHPANWTLTARGHTAAKTLAASMPQTSASTLFSSPEPKAVQTANYFGEPTILEGLREHLIRDPAWLPADELERSVKAYFIEPKRRVFGDESRDEAVARFRLALQDAAAATAGDVLAVSHGRIIASYLGSLIGTSGYELWRLLTMPAVVSICEFDTRPTIRAIQCCVT